MKKKQSESVYRKELLRTKILFLYGSGNLLLIDLLQGHFLLGHLLLGHFLLEAK